MDAAAGAVGTFLNKAIDILPVELHFPGYQYCGPGTKLRSRLNRGDPGINKLDAACKQHDIAYANYKDNKTRARADQLLAERAWERVRAEDSSLGEKAAAWAVTNIMKGKRALGSGRKNNKKTKKNQKHVNRKNKKPCKKGKGLYLRPYKGSGTKKKNNNKSKKR